MVGVKASPAFVHRETSEHSRKGCFPWGLEEPPWLGSHPCPPVKEPFLPASDRERAARSESTVGGFGWQSGARM